MGRNESPNGSLALRSCHPTLPLMVLPCSQKSWTEASGTVSQPTLFSLEMQMLGATFCLNDKKPIPTAQVPAGLCGAAPGCPLLTWATGLQAHLNPLRCESCLVTADALSTTLLASAAWHEADCPTQVRLVGFSPQGIYGGFWELCSCHQLPELHKVRAVG